MLKEQQIGRMLRVFQIEVRLCDDHCFVRQQFALLPRARTTLYLCQVVVKHMVPDGLLRGPVDHYATLMR